LATPVAVGPLTVSGQYLSVVVARPDKDTITITGPKYMVNHFEMAVKAAKPVGLSE
jgi:hypothetical protein